MNREMSKSQQNSSGGGGGTLLDHLNDKDWTQKNFVVEFQTPKQDIDINTNNIKFSMDPSRPSVNLIDRKLYKTLISVKNIIGEIKADNKLYLWNKWVKLINPYEKISSFSTRVNEPISRAFFKLHEILTFFEYPIDPSGVSLHLCEAPGGFIRCVEELYPSMDWYGHTLYEGGGSLTINKSLLVNPKKWILLNHPKYEKSGNLYIPKTIFNIKKIIGVKVDLITADGGFDVSCDPNNQEQLSLQLILCEIVTALICQKAGGVFICKIFDTFTKPTCQLIYLLMKYYEKVSIIKPRSSRFSNSEKYLVCSNFKEIKESDVTILMALCINWKKNKKTYCRDLGIVLSEEFENTIINYNKFLANNQIWYINFILKNYSISKDMISQFEVLQNKRALEYCKYFNLCDNKSNGKFHCNHSKVRKVSISTYNMSNIVRCANCLTLFYYTNNCVYDSKILQI